MKANLLALTIAIIFLGSCKKDHQDAGANSKTDLIDAHSRRAEQVLSNYKRVIHSRGKSQSNLKELDSLQYYIELVSNYYLADTFQVIDIESIDTIDVTISKTQETYFDLDQLQEIIDIDLTDFKAEVVGSNQHLLLIAFEVREETDDNVTFKCSFYVGKVLVCDDLGEEMMPSVVNGFWTFPAGDYRMGFGTESTKSSFYGLTQCFGGNGTSPGAPQSNFTTFWGGVCGQYTKSTGGAATLLQKFGEYNIFETIGTPAGPPPGRKYVIMTPERVYYEPNNTYTESNPYYDPDIFFGNPTIDWVQRRNLHWPTKVFGFNSWVKDYMDNTKVYNPNLMSAPCLTGAMCNYYLGNITGDLFSDGQSKANTQSQVGPLAFIGFKVLMDDDHNYVGHVSTQCSYYWEQGQNVDVNYFCDSQGSSCLHIGSYYKYEYLFGKRVSIPE